MLHIQLCDYTTSGLSVSFSFSSFFLVTHHSKRFFVSYNSCAHFPNSKWSLSSKRTNKKSSMQNISGFYSQKSKKIKKTMSSWWVWKSVRPLIVTASCYSNSHIVCSHWIHITVTEEYESHFWLFNGFYCNCCPRLFSYTHSKQCVTHIKFQLFNSSEMQSRNKH